jgi:hypothetical protein
VVIGVLDDAQLVQGKVAGPLDLDRQHIGVGCDTDGRIDNDDVPDALATGNADVVGAQRCGREIVDEVDEQEALPVGFDGRIQIEHFEKIDAVERGSGDRVAA